MSYGGSGNGDEELRLKVVYDASPAVKAATDDLRDLKKEVSALEAVMATLDTKVDEAGAEFKEFYTDTTGLTSALKTLEIQVEEVGIGFAGLSGPVAIAEEEFDNLTKTVVRTAGAGSGESGVGGFAGLTKNIFLAEKSLLALGTGHGIARVGPMLEKLIGAAGGPAGVGFGIAGLAFLLETIGPKVKTFLESWAEASGIIDATSHVKEMADELERALKAAEALEKTPTAQEAKTKTMVTAAIVERHGAVQQQIEMALTKTEDLETYIKPEDKQAWEALKTHPGDFADPAGAREKILGRAREERHKRAEIWTEQLRTDKGSRMGLQQLAKAAPGIISPMFLDELAMAEPEAQIEAEQQKRAETAAGKESTTWGNKRKKEIKAGKEWQRGEDMTKRAYDQMEKQDETDRRKDDDLARSYDEWAIREQNADDNKATREHTKAKHAKEQQDRKYAHEHTPQALLHAQAEREEGEALGAVQQSTHGFGADQQKAIAKHLRESYQQGYGFANTFEEILGDAIRQSNEEMQRGALARLKRQSSYGEMR